MNKNVFKFGTKNLPLDWKKIGSISIEKVTSDGDLSVLQDNLLAVVFCDVSHEFKPEENTPTLLKLFKLSQLMLEYLLHTQDQFVSQLQQQEKQLICLQQTKQQNDKEHSKVLEENVEQVEKWKKEAHKRKKIIITQQKMIRSADSSFLKCEYCNKVFMAEGYLQKHMMKQHQDMLKIKQCVKDDAWSETEKNIKNMEMKLCGAAKALQEERERAAEIEAEVACVRLKSVEVAKIAVKQKNELLDLEEEVAKLKQTLQVTMKERNELEKLAAKGERAVRENQINKTLVKELKTTLAEVQAEMIKVKKENMESKMLKWKSPDAINEKSIARTTHDGLLREALERRDTEWRNRVHEEVFKEYQNVISANTSWNQASSVGLSTKKEQDFNMNAFQGQQASTTSYNNDFSTTMAVFHTPSISRSRVDKKGMEDSSEWSVSTENEASVQLLNTTSLPTRSTTGLMKSGKKGAISVDKIKSEPFERKKKIFEGYRDDATLASFLEGRKRGRKKSKELEKGTQLKWQDGKTGGKLDERMDERMNERMDGRVNEKVDGWIDGRMYGRVDGGMNEKMSEASYGVVDEKTDGRLDEGMDGKVYEGLVGRINEKMDGTLNEELYKKSNEGMDEKTDERMAGMVEERVDERMDEKLDERLDGRLDERIDGRMDERIDGRMEEKLNERTEERKGEMDEEMQEIKGYLLHSVMQKLASMGIKSKHEVAEEKFKEVMGMLAAERKSMAEKLYQFEEIRRRYINVSEEMTSQKRKGRRSDESCEETESSSESCKGTPGRSDEDEDNDDCKDSSTIVDQESNFEKISDLTGDWSTSSLDNWLMKAKQNLASDSGSD